MSDMIHGPCGDPCLTGGGYGAPGRTRISNSWNNPWQELNNFFKAKKFVFQDRFERSMYLHSIGENKLVKSQIAQLGPGNPTQQFAVAKWPKQGNFKLQRRQEQGPLKLSSAPEIEMCYYELGNELATMIKWSEEVMHHIDELFGFGNYTQSLNAMFSRDVLNRASQDILPHLISSPDSCNVGPNAGKKTQSINTGMSDAPRALTPEDVTLIFQQARQIFREQDVDPMQLQSITGSSSMTLLAPSVFELYLSQTQLIDRMGLAQCADICRYYLNPTFDWKVHGFDIIFDDCLMDFVVEQPNGDRAFPLIFLCNGSFAFDIAFSNAEIDHGPYPYEDHDWYWRAKLFYGYMLMHPELLTVFWVTIPQLPPIA